MSMRTAIQLFGAYILCGVLGIGIEATSVRAETPPEGKTEPAPPPRAKEPELKPKEPEAKPAEPKVKEAETKPKEAEQKPKDVEVKPEPKPKEPEAKPKEVESKPKEPPAKPKDADHKPKEAEHKPKEGEQKPKDAEQKAKDSDKAKESDVAVEKPCPVPPQAETKAAAESTVPAGEGAVGDRPKAPEADTKKPMRSSMVTAKLALMADPRLFPYDIEVDAKDKDLVLLGKVASDHDKRAATDIVRCLEGVHGVENRLKVEPDATRGLIAERDKILTQLVRERFEKSKTLQSVKFDVKTEDGIVTLTGTTRFQVIVLEAAQAARQVPGVRAVNTDGVRLVAGE